MTGSKKAIIWIVVIILLAALGVVGYYTYQRGQELKNKESEVTDLQNQVASNQAEEVASVPTAETCVADECLKVENLEYPAGQLPASVSAAVKKGLDDEYKAFSVYDAVIKKIGSKRPFSMIIRAEESHIASLKAVLDKYGETIATNPYLGKIAVKDTLQENCQIGVDAEIANAALYKDELIPAATAYPDITSVFTRLMDASLDNHLPSFEKCN